MNKSKQQVIIQVLVTLGILILVNIISIRIFSRLDLTSTKAYSLSDASKNLVKNLDDKFLVKAYFTAELPAPYNNNRRLLKDQLDDYRAYSKGNFQYELIDPSSKPEIEQEAQRYGIPPVQVQVVKDDKLQIEKAYMGLVLLYGDKQEQIPVVQNLDKIEYEISSKIKKLTSSVQRKVGLLSGEGEPDMEKIKQFQQLITQQYELVPVSLENRQPISTDITVLIIDAPKQKFSDTDKYLVDQYLMRGGKIAFFINQVEATLQQQMGQTLTTGLEDLLEAYGVRINADLVRDARCANVTMQQQAGYMTFQSQVPYPYLVVASEFNPKSVVTKNLNPVMFHFVSSIDTSLARTKAVKMDVLLTTSNKSGRMQGYFLINPTQQMTLDMFKEQFIPLAVSVEGSFKSLYADKQAALDSIGQLNINLNQKINASTGTKIVVVGDGDFIQDAYAGTKDNLVFANNLVDWLADDVGLTTIRTKEVSVKPLEEVSDGTRTFVKSLNLAAPPLLIILVGVVRWRLRIARRKRIEMTP
jgi:gliding-associated putative ABC transporter substrate-binding component GldG